MSDTIIRVENLGKKYLISHQKQERYTALRDVIANGAKSWRHKLLKPLGRKILDPPIEEFWALQDVSFEIKRGDRVGIIGRNGAGKSTLLKILSRITEPTTGRISIKGRVASLLEVGTGFHPELTGRENIYLNGTILGMSKAEIKSKFDEIVAFAEVEKFLDTPVKRYSSGMYVRLAFAVAAHLETEILIVDEVLAVGDTQFQEKCLGKMEDFGKSGKTVLFVSHNINAIERLCESALLLEKGAVKIFSQDIHCVIKKYIFDQKKSFLSSEWINYTGTEFNNKWFKPTKFFIADAHGNTCLMPLTNNSDIWVQIEGEIQDFDPALTIGYAIYSEEGSLLYWSYQTDSCQNKWPLLNKGFCVLRSQMPKRLLNEGIYKLELAGGIHFREWLFEPGKKSPCIYLTIQGGLSDSPYWMAKRPGILAPVISWEAKTYN